MQKSRHVNAESIQQTVLLEEREIIFGVINPIFSALKNAVDLNNTSQTHEINILREVVQAYESRMNVNESRITELSDHMDSDIRDLNGSIQRKMLSALDDLT